MSSNKIRLIIVDDHKIIRDGLKLYFQFDDQIEIVGEAENGQTALTLVKELNFDILITDISMPIMDGLELVKVLKEEQKVRFKIICLTMQSDAHHIKKMLSYGVEGYLLKTAHESEVIKAIHETMETGNYYSPNVTDTIMKTLSGRIVNKKRTVALEVPLSSREMEILHLIVKQYSNLEIADELFISIRTVETHKRNLLEKTGAKNIAGLVLFALEKRFFDDI